MAKNNVNLMFLKTQRIQRAFIDNESYVISDSKIPDGLIGLDMGPKTIRNLKTLSLNQKQ